MKFDILLHSHEDSVSLTLGAGAIFSYIASTIIASEQILMSNSSLLRGSREVLSHLRGEDWRINKGSHIHVPLPSTEQLPSLSLRHQRRSFSVHKPCRGLSLLWPGLLLSRPKSPTQLAQNQWAPWHAQALQDAAVHQVSLLSFVFQHWLQQGLVLMELCPPIQGIELFTLFYEFRGIKTAEPYLVNMTAIALLPASFTEKNMPLVILI